MYKEIKGDLIDLALIGEFDVIAHGCNCFCTMGAGIAVAMKNTFGCDRFELEKEEYKGNIDKLGTIQYRNRIVNTSTGQVSITSFAPIKFPSVYVTIVNAYTQYHYGKNHSDGKENPVDYEAITLCMRKINHIFKGKHIGLPQIGCGLAGGDWNIVKSIIQNELTDCDVTVVIYDKTRK